MKSLIDFLLSNIWLPILVFLIIRFAKSYPGQNSKGPSRRVTVPKSVPQSSGQGRASVGPMVSEHSYATVDPIYKKSTLEQADIAIIKAKQPKAVNNNKGSTKHNEVNASVPLSSAVQGMMWSEVFGPPRSKKPYQPK